MLGAMMGHSASGSNAEGVGGKTDNTKEPEKQMLTSYNVPPAPSTDEFSIMVAAKQVMNT